MKRKKWSEVEEQSLLTKYSDLVNTGTLSKFKTREKKFRPIADYVNAMHHLQDPLTFPFRWSWRDVSIKVQNMRHQYLGVKQKIKVSNSNHDEFNWSDGEHHWENFLMYKQVFGDVQISNKKLTAAAGGGCSDTCDLGFYDEESESESESDFGCGMGFGEVGADPEWGSSKGFGLLAGQVMGLRSVVAEREEKGMEREFSREEDEMEGVEKRRRMECERERRRDEIEEEVESREAELEQRELKWARRVMERGRLERELDEERRRRRMRMEEMRDEEEKEWRERMMGLQIEHEKTMMQMQADACQNQVHILGVMARFVCQFLGAGTDGLGGGLGGLPPQVLQNLHHPGELGDNGKPDSNSPSEFI